MEKTDRVCEDCGVVRHRENMYRVTVPRSRKLTTKYFCRVCGYRRFGDEHKRE